MTLKKPGGPSTPNKRIKQIGKGDGGYKTECVFLSGVNEDLRKNGIKFKKELLKAVSNIKTKEAKLARSGSVMLTPVTPEDVKKLLKEDWTKHSFLGTSTQASLPKHKKIEYKAVILGVDPELEESDIEEELKNSNNITATAVRRRQERM